jgi:hypothetical protein
MAHVEIHHCGWYLEKGTGEWNRPPRHVAEHPSWVDVRGDGTRRVVAPCGATWTPAVYLWSPGYWVLVYSDGRTAHLLGPDETHYDLSTLGD